MTKATWSSSSAKTARGDRPNAQKAGFRRGSVVGSAQSRFPSVTREDRVKRVVAIVVGVLAALTLLPAANAAAGYPPSGPELGASSSSPPPGGTVTLTASGFCPGGTVTFTLDPGGTVLGTATADSDG